MKKATDTVIFILVGVVSNAVTNAYNKQLMRLSVLELHTNTRLMYQVYQPTPILIK